MISALAANEEDSACVWRTCSLFSFSCLGDVSQCFAVRLQILTQLQALVKSLSQYQQNQGCKEPGLEEEEPEVCSLLSFLCTGDIGPGRE